MNNLPRQKLYELIKIYGADLYENPQRCKGFLSDFCGTHKKEIEVLVIALQENVVNDLQQLHIGVPTDIILKKLVKKLEDNRAIAKEAAIWAVESWALALGIISSVSIDNPEDRPTTHTKHQVIQYNLNVNLISANKNWQYSIDLTEAEENNPKQFFDKESASEFQRFKIALEKELGRKLSNSQIKSLLDNWCSTIIQGYRMAYSNFN